MERISYKELPQGFLNGLLAGQEYIDNAGLDFSLLELIRMRVSQINSCAYCLDMHFKEGLAHGETALRLISVSAWRETPYYTPKEQAVLAFAERLTRLPAEEHSDDIHNELSKYFSKREIALLTLAIIQINSWNRLVRSFGTVPGKYEVKKKVNAL
ncbi:carboxymuconolactone decarboxylase family protein [Chryseosolibacter indicus]|nr:carboxymuconolactone decarboxylase family protein [Chryseosolibacter indicus]